MHDILSYLAAAYDPIAIIVYGSFADGTSNLFSDFDALLVTADGERRHDDRFVDFTQLDVFVHPLSDFQGEYDPAEYARIYGGQILLDRDGVAAALLERVTQWVTATTEIYTELRGWPYLGPKKALAQLEKKDRAVFALYEKALTQNEYASLAAWVEHIRERYEKGQKKRRKA